MVIDDKMPPLWTGEAPAEGYIMTHPIKAAGTAALCWVFSIVQRKDRLSGGTAPQGFPAG